MDITNELLAAYAEGNVTPEERKYIRQYLAEHPSQLESVMLMMDEEPEMYEKQQKKDISFMGLRQPKVRETSFAGSAFVPQASDSCFEMTDSLNPIKFMGFNERLGKLLDDIT